jgi:hypothetical protein
MPEGISSSSGSILPAALRQLKTLQVRTIVDDASTAKEFRRWPLRKGKDPAVEAALKQSSMP